jgi:dihydrofolate synthase/folylpolyglutamate synthase
MQFIPGKIPKILDVAHNSESVRVLVKNISKIRCLGQTHLVVGMLKDKDHSEVFKVLNNIADSWNVITLLEERGSDAKRLIIELKSLGISKNVFEYKDVSDALKQLDVLSMPGDRIIVTGSFLTVGAALDYLNKDTA